MNIRLENAGKKFNKHWLFRAANLELRSGESVGIVGRNGSGKSTLLHILSGYSSLSEGQIEWTNNSQEITADSVFKYVSLCSPVLSLYEEMTLAENFIFCSRFKTELQRMSAETFAEQLELQQHVHQQIKFYSSGMRQRVKLGMAILSDSPLLLLDEPTSHLDDEACKWYEQLLKKNSESRTVVVATNEKERDASLCTRWLSMHDFKVPDGPISADH